MNQRDAVAAIEAALAGRKGKKHGTEILFQCPAHDDKNPSASWSTVKEAWNCFTCGEGGSWRELAKRLQIDVEDSKAPEGRIVKEYSYRDEAGKELYQVVRMEPKTFRQRRRVGPDWSWSLGNTRRVLYRLPELLASTGRIYLCEGEKDADAVGALGFTATTNSEGAERWRAEFSALLAGREVVVLEDNDDAGRKRTALVASSLSGHGCAVRVLALPGLEKKEDISDWLARGGSAPDLDALADAAPEWAEKARPLGINGFQQTDAGNAELFAHLYGDRLRFDHMRGRWLLWHGHRWGEDGDGQLHRWGKDTARARYQAAVDIDETAERRKASAYAITCESKAKIDAMLSLARSEYPVADSGNGWDANPRVLGVANGVVNLTTGDLRSGRQDERITIYTGMDFDPEARCDRWMQFLEEVFDGDEGLINFIQRAVGYSITGLTTEQVLFLCHGSGSNGKSVFLSTIRAMSGDYGANMAFATLEERGDRGGATPELASLVGKRLVTASETAEMSKLNEARVKALTGSDMVTARELYQKQFTFRPEMKIWLAVNHLPRVDDDSEGFWRRVRLIPFGRQFSGPERDPDLEEKLHAELPGILAWAIRGAIEWQREGLQPPIGVMLRTQEYRQSSDPLAEFIAECCILGASVGVSRGVLYKAYWAWCDTQGMQPKERLGAQTFGRRIGERFENRKSNGVRVYRGLTPKDSDFEQEMVFEQGRNVPKGTYPVVDVTFSSNFSELIVPRVETLETDVPSDPSVPFSGLGDCAAKHPDGRSCDGRAGWLDEETDEWHCRKCHPRNTEVNI